MRRPKGSLAGPLHWTIFPAPAAGPGAAQLKLASADASSSKVSKTVYSLVI
jgi:hypothetical protein